MTRSSSPRAARRALTTLAFVVALIVVAGVVGACSVFGNDLTSHPWKLIAITGATSNERVEVAAENQARYMITFADDGNATIKADCNNVMATYTAERDGRISIVPGPSTLVACPDDSQADVFLSGLGAATSYNVYGSGMSLTIGTQGSLEFAATE